MKAFAALFVLTLGVTSVAAQAPVPLTNAQLRAKVAALQLEIAGLQSDHKILVAACAPPVAPARAAARPLDTMTTTDAQVLVAAHAKLAEVTANAQRDQVQQQQRLDAGSWTVSTVDFRATESNSTFVRYGWKATVSNGLLERRTFDLTVQFFDASGYMIDTDTEYNQVVAAQDTTTVYGSALIRMPGARNVAAARALAGMKR